MINIYGANIIPLQKKVVIPIIPIPNGNYYIPHDYRKARSIERRNEYFGNLGNSPLKYFHKNQFQNPNLTTVNNNITKFRPNNNQYNFNTFTNSNEHNKINGNKQYERNIHVINKNAQQFDTIEHNIIMNSPNGERILDEEPQDSDVKNREKQIKKTTKNNNEKKNDNKRIVESQSPLKNKNIALINGEKGKENKKLKEVQLPFKKINYVDKVIQVSIEGENIRELYEIYVNKCKVLEKENIDLNAKIENLQKEINEIKIKYEELINRIKSNNIMKLYNSPTLIGLNNIGATCFMNSTLQCLSQTKELTNYFLNVKNKERIINNNIALKNKNEYQLSPVYLELLDKLWEIDGEKSFSPYTLMNTINNMNPLFKTGQAGDAKDFIIFILEQLHKELKQPIKTINNNNFNENQFLNQYDKNNSFNYFFNDFKKECSIISDLFFGFNETTNECLNCKKVYNSKGLNSPICYSYGIFNCLIFPLEEVKNMKNNSQQNNYIQTNNNIVSLYDCFYYNQKSDLFTGENRNYCNNCKQIFDSIYCSKIYISPNILVLILNRGKGNVYNVKLDFSEMINITQYVLENDSSQLIYNLYGVITHIGQSGPNAHFVASCKSPIDNKWYRYNDAIVNQITNLQKEVIEFGTPYILFYQKNNK